jgi:anti-sigma factor RsiW
MNCRKSEKRVLLSLDGRLDAASEAEMREHIRNCPACTRMENEYRKMFGLLRNERKDELLPDFWERLRPGLARERKSFVLLLWERWCVRAVPVFLGATLAFGIGLIFFAPRSQAPMTQSELLLLRNQNGLSENQSIFDEAKGDGRHIELIFAADQTPGGGKNRP